MIGQKGRTQTTGHRGRKTEGGGRRAPDGTVVSRLSSAVWFTTCLLGVPWVAAATYSGGNGTDTAPYLIATAADFKAIGANPGDWDKQFKLTQDIDLSDSNDVSLHMIGHWAGLGAAGNQPFRGVFDGNGKSISNFRYQNLTDDYIGLFQLLSGTIQNLRLVRPTVVANQTGAGALVGIVQNGSVVSCSAFGVRVSGNIRVGGLVGSLDGVVSKSRSDGSVAGVQYVGGLVGQIDDGTVSLSYSKARVAGGSASQCLGGLVGVMVQETSVVQWCYATGDVQGGTYVGGLVGQMGAGRVWQSYSAGKVTGRQPVGGLVGGQKALTQVVNSVWDTQTSGQTTSAGGIGKTTEQMKTWLTFAGLGWDFNTIWTNWEGVGYPVFFWQIPPGDLHSPDGVDFLDFAVFAQHWRNRNCSLSDDCAYTDLDQSGVVDWRDLAIFAENWLTGLP